MKRWMMEAIVRHAEAARLRLGGGTIADELVTGGERVVRRTLASSRIDALAQIAVVRFGPGEPGGWLVLVGCDP